MLVQAKAKLRPRVPAPRGRGAHQGERGRSGCCGPASPHCSGQGSLPATAGSSPPNSDLHGQGRARSKTLGCAVPWLRLPQPSPGLHLASPTTARKPPPPWLGHSLSQRPSMAPTAQASPFPKLSSPCSSSPQTRSASGSATCGVTCTRAGGGGGGGAFSTQPAARPSFPFISNHLTVPSSKHPPPPRKTRAE